MKKRTKVPPMVGHLPLFAGELADIAGFGTVANVHQEEHDTGMHCTYRILKCDMLSLILYVHHSESFGELG